MRILTPCLLATACAPLYDLDDVPIFGATAEQVSALRAELHYIDDTMAVDGLQLGPITVRPIDEELGGQFRTWNHRITLNDDMSTYQMREILRHEVCHALDQHLGFPSERRDGMDAMSVFWGDEGHNMDRPSRDAERREAFAQTCDLGPAALTALADASCQGDDLVTTEADWVRSVVVRPDQLGPRRVPVAPGRPMHVPEGRFWTRAFTDGSIEVHTSGETFQLQATEPETVANHQRRTAIPAGSPLEGFWRHAPLPFHLLGTYQESVHGHAAVIAKVPGASETTLFLASSDGYWAAAGCAALGTDLLQDANGDLVVAWTPDDPEWLRVERLE